MNLRAWTEKEENLPDPFTSEGVSFKSAVETYYENTIDDESYARHYQMPSLGPEDDWITETPYPIFHPRGYTHF